MKTKRVTTIAMLAGAIATCVSISTASAQSVVYGIQSGTSSITLHKAALDTLSYTITGTTGTTTPQVGYTAGFPIVTTTSAEEMFMFTADPDFTPVGGIIEHTGVFHINDGAINLGNFVIGFDEERMTEANTGFFVTDGADLAPQVLFDVGNPVSNTFDGTEWHFIDSNLFMSPELAGFLGNPALSGQDFGDLRIDALTFVKVVPEPSSALLAFLGGSILLFRRRR